jgi:hypothetical protein
LIDLVAIQIPPEIQVHPPKNDRTEWSGLEKLRIANKYRSSDFFCKIFLKSTTRGSKIGSAPQLVGGTNFH